MRKVVNLSLLFALLGLTGCISESDLKTKLENVIEKNPEIVTKSIEKNPVLYVEAFQKAVKNAQEEIKVKREQEEKQKLEELYDKPLQPVITKDDIVRGNKENAAITLIEYSDFECPFCTRGYNTVMDLLKKYDGKIRFVYKHLPLSFHQSAMLTAKYYEAARLQSPEKAMKFHDEVFNDQKKLKNGEQFLNSIVKNLGLDLAKIKKDLDSPAVINKIKSDMEEAEKFGFQGTPGFIINGIPVKGAYPVKEFEDIVEELKKRGKLTL